MKSAANPFGRALFKNLCGLLAFAPSALPDAEEIFMRAVDFLVSAVFCLAVLNVLSVRP